MKILYATDGSDGARTAGCVLASLPLPPETRITVLSAVPEYHWLDTPLFADVAVEEEAAARRMVEAAAGFLRETHVPLTTVVRHRNPAAAILEQAEADGADLIVVGSHGIGAIERFLIGSVSERVARHAHCSVLVVRSRTLKRVIVGVDDSEASEQALDALARLPLPAEAELTALHVLGRRDAGLPLRLVPGMDWEKVIEEYDRACHAEGDRIVRHAQDRLDSAGRAARTDVRCGAPAHDLVAAAREWGADLLVIGAANCAPLGRLFLGSVSGRVLTHAPCSVLVCRSK